MIFFEKLIAYLFFGKKGPNKMLENQSFFERNCAKIKHAQCYATFKWK